MKTLPLRIYWDECETNLDGVCIYRFAKICVSNKLIKLILDRVANSKDSLQVEL